MFLYCEGAPSQHATFETKLTSSVEILLEIPSKNEIFSALRRDAATVR